MTRISLKVSGGFAAAVRRPEQAIDTAALPASERKELDALLARVRGEPAPPGPPKRRPDAMSYIVEMEDAAGTTTLRRADGEMTPAFAELLAWFRRRGTDR